MKKKVYVIENKNGKTKLIVGPAPLVYEVARIRTIRESNPPDILDTLSDLGESFHKLNLHKRKTLEDE